MNVCTFSGRLTADATEFIAQSGTSILSMNIAIDCGFGENKKTLFMRCKAFKRGGMVPHLTKGKPIIVSGEMQPNEYTDKNGNEVRTMELICREIDFQQGQPAGQQQSRQQAPHQERHSEYRENVDPSFPSEASGIDVCPF